MLDKLSPDPMHFRGTLGDLASFIGATVDSDLADLEVRMSGSSIIGLPEGASYYMRDGAPHLGKVGPEYRTVGVIPFLRSAVTAPDWSQFVGANATVSVSGESLVVVGSERDIQRVASLVSMLSEPSAAWYCDVYVVHLDRSAAERVGVDWSLAASAEGSIPGGVTYGVDLAAILQLSKTSELVEVQEAARLGLIPGKAGTLSSGTQVVIPRRVVSDAGTVTDVGYDVVNSGFNLEVTAERIEDGALLTVSVSQSSVASIVSGRPALDQRSYASVVPVLEGSIVALGGFESDASTGGGDWFASQGRSRSSRRTYVILALRPL